VAASFGARARFGAGAFAIAAGGRRVDSYLTLAAKGSLDQREPLLDLEIAPAAGAPTPEAKTTATTAREHLGEKVLHLGEHVADAPAIGGSTTLEPLVAEAVVHGTFLLVGKAFGSPWLRSG
jgi:hypothetical protein